MYIHILYIIIIYNIIMYIYTVYTSLYICMSIYDHGWSLLLRGRIIHLKQNLDPRSSSNMTGGTCWPLEFPPWAAKPNLCEAEECVAGAHPPPASFLWTPWSCESTETGNRTVEVHGVQWEVVMKFEYPQHPTTNIKKYCKNIPTPKEGEGGGGTKPTCRIPPFFCLKTLG